MENDFFLSQKSKNGSKKTSDVRRPILQDWRIQRAGGGRRTVEGGRNNKAYRHRMPGQWTKDNGQRIFVQMTKNGSKRKARG